MIEASAATKKSERITNPMSAGDGNGVPLAIVASSIVQISCPAAQERAASPTSRQNVLRSRSRRAAKRQRTSAAVAARH